MSDYVTDISEQPEPFLLSVFLLSAWKNDLVGGAGLMQFIFQPWTPPGPPWPRPARPVRGEREAPGDKTTAAGTPLF